MRVLNNPKINMVRAGGVFAAISVRFRSLPAGIWALGFVSMMMDISSELVHSLLPVFMTSVLGIGMVAIGVVEGVAEATAAISKVFSGAISDHLKKRKLLAVLGYGLGALSKPIFPLANSIGWVFCARFIDRIGKGIRGAPRDALVADITPPQLRGAAYGLRQSLDSIGAFIGPLLAVLLMDMFANNVKSVLWVSVVPALICLGILIAAVHEPVHAEEGTSNSLKLSIRAYAKFLPVRFWLIIVLGTVVTLARFSEAFLILRAQNAGLAIGYVPLVFIVMNIVYSGVSYPAGIASDRFSARTLLIIGLAVLVAADLVLAGATAPLQVLCGAALWGLHMGVTQGLLSKLVADTAPKELRGTAFGIFNLVCGGALLLASITAGALWSAYGPSATFIAGAAFAGTAMLGLLIYR